MYIKYVILKLTSSINSIMQTIAKCVLCQWRMNDTSDCAITDLFIFPLTLRSSFRCFSEHRLKHSDPVFIDGAPVIHRATSAGMQHTTQNTAFHSSTPLNIPLYHHNES